MWAWLRRALQCKAVCPDCNKKRNVLLTHSMYFNHGYKLKKHPNQPCTKPVAGYQIKKESVLKVLSEQEYMLVCAHAKQFSCRQKTACVVNS